MTSQVQVYNISQAFCHSDEHADIGYAKPTAGLGAGLGTHAASKAGTAFWDAVSQSATNGWRAASEAITALWHASQNATNGWIKDVLDYTYDNPKTSVASAIAGIAGSVLGPLYFQTAIADAGAVLFNAVMKDTILDFLQSVASETKSYYRDVTIPVPQAVIQGALAAANNARYNTVLRQNLGVSLVSGLGAAIVPHVLNYVGKTISNSCTAQDGYCNQGMAGVSKIRIGA